MPGPQDIVIAGPNGAGKSTLAPYFLRDRLGLSQYVNADTIALGLSAFQPEEVAFEAGRVMLKRLRDLAERRESFAFETTPATRSYEPWLRRLCQNGYRFHLSFLWLRSPDVAVQRVRGRVVAGGHDVSEEVIRRRYRRGAVNFFSLYQPMADTWGVYDNSALSDPVLIAAGEKTTWGVLSHDLWHEFCEAAK